MDEDNMTALFTVVYGGNQYYIMVSYEPRTWVISVQELVLAELKANVSALRTMDINIDWLTLKTLDGDVINADTMPEGDEFLADLSIPKFSTGCHLV